MQQNVGQEVELEILADSGVKFMEFEAGYQQTHSEEEERSIEDAKVEY